MPNKNSKKRAREVASPAFSIASSSSSISDFSNDILDNPKNQPIPYDRATMRQEVAKLKKDSIRNIHKKLKKTAGKKYKRKNKKRKTKKNKKHKNK
jgi:hypothetical protein